MIKEHDYQFKIVIVGNVGVGKSSLFTRFCDQIFAQSYLPTIGVDFKFKVLEHDGNIIRLQIWDTAGQEKFRTITSAYYRSSQAVVIVYDKTDKQTFDEIEAYWLQQVRNNSDSNVHLVIAGNKTDMESKIPDAQVTSLTTSLGVPSYAVSAKTGEGVEGMFKEICEALVKREKVSKKQKQQLKLQSKKTKPQNKCCK